MSKLRICFGAAAASTALVITGFVGFVASAQAATPACGNSSLTVTRSNTDGAGGHGGLVLFFRNSSHQSCSLRGYPALDEVNENGRVTARAKRTLSGYFGGATSVRTVTLAPGAFAAARADWINVSPVDGHNCTHAAYLEAIPVGTSRAVRIPAASTTNCGLQVHPTVSGLYGDRDFARAQEAWLQGAHASFPANGGYWQQARTFLLRAKFVAYDDATKALTQLVLLPDAHRTAKQNAEHRADIRLVDAFFATPSLYG